MAKGFSMVFFSVKFDQLLENGIDQWGMDIFKLAECTSNPLTCVTYTILKVKIFLKKDYFA